MKEVFSTTVIECFGPKRKQDGKSVSALVTVYKDGTKEVGCAWQFSEENTCLLAEECVYLSPISSVKKTTENPSYKRQE